MSGRPDCCRRLLSSSYRRSLFKQGVSARHRAGLGITEQSDAVAVIVSEETGIVSIAHNGVLTRYLDEKKLRKMLIDLCAPPQTEGLNLDFWPWKGNK